MSEHYTDDDVTAADAPSWYPASEAGAWADGWNAARERLAPAIAARAHASKPSDCHCPDEDWPIHTKPGCPSVIRVTGGLRRWAMSEHDRAVLRAALDRHDERRSWCAAHSEGQWCCLDKKESPGGGVVQDNPIREAIEHLLVES